ncbi:hypothetical protein LWI29_021882 [Acer saccharum]|uniref:Uncharacterized protein n=1 Tax=Acer saccharum TaxID=4024 RepID=A0AA39RS70_ACESA|nr:hypothetical protein LWI29_021882 [Acer saccharum]
MDSHRFPVNSSGGDVEDSAVDGRKRKIATNDLVAMDSASDQSDSSSDQVESRDVNQGTTNHMEKQQETRLKSKQQENRSKSNQNSWMNRSQFMSQDEPMLTKKQCEN